MINSEQEEVKTPKSKQVKLSSVFDTLLDENFFITVRDNPLPKVQQLRKSDWMYICLTSERNKLNKVWCELWDDYVFLKQDKDKPVTAFMDIKWSRMKFLIDDNVAGKKVCSIKFSKFRSYEELFNSDVNLLFEWFHELK